MLERNREIKEREKTKMETWMAGVKKREKRIMRESIFMSKQEVL